MKIKTCVAQENDKLEKWKVSCKIKHRLHLKYPKYLSIFGVVLLEKKVYLPVIFHTQEAKSPLIMGS